MSQNRTFGDQDARAAWNDAARAWEEFVESGADYYRHQVHGPALLAVCEPLRDLDVLDLGCGQGFFSRQLAKRGARVVAIDLAEELLAFALRHEKEEPLGIAYHLMNAQQVNQRWEECSFDLVTGCMSLHDMADPGAILKSAYDVLKPDGRMAFSIPHPFTDTPFRQWEVDEAGEKGALKIDHYFESGPAVCYWRMQRLIYHWDTPYWRCTLTEWTAMIAEAGFLMRRLHEPRPTPEQVQRNPNLDDCFRLPSFLAFDLVKPG
jgi:2-polyprenyl-3-methyl-5-hydroxy-6-metoxy-1,4-benzoquinol methylase